MGAYGFETALPADLKPLLYLSPLCRSGGRAVPSPWPTSPWCGTLIIASTNRKGRRGLSSFWTARRSRCGCGLGINRAKAHLLSACAPSYGPPHTDTWLGHSCFVAASVLACPQLPPSPAQEEAESQVLVEAAAIESARKEEEAARRASAEHGACMGGGDPWHYGDEGSVQRVGNCSAGRTAQSLPPSRHRERRSVPHLPMLACGLLADCSPPAMPGTPSPMPSLATLQAAALGPAAFPRRQQARRRPPAPAPCPPSPTSRRWACRRSSMNPASPPCPPSAPSCAAPSAESWQRASPPACSPPSEEKEEGCAVVQGPYMLRPPARLGPLPSWGDLHDDLASAVSGVGGR